jgi:hypothetical protein
VTAGIAAAEGAAKLSLPVQQIFELEIMMSRNQHPWDSWLLQQDTRIQMTLARELSSFLAITMWQVQRLCTDM